jgi:hypothetical protein
MRWAQIDLEQGLPHVSRVKNGVDPSAARTGDPGASATTLRVSDRPYVFTTERRATMTGCSVRKIFAHAGDQANLGFPVHPLCCAMPVTSS